MEAGRAERSSGADDGRYAAWAIFAGIFLGLGALVGFAVSPADLLFQDHDRYGSVPMGESAALELPLGEVNVYVEGSSITGGAGGGLRLPEHLDVRVAPVGGGRPLPISEDALRRGVIGTSGGYERFGTVELAEAGAYRVTASGGTPPESARTPEFTFGIGPWTPLGSVFVTNTILTALAIFGLWYVLPSVWEWLRGLVSRS